MEEESERKGSFEPPTYEEYLKATAFARVKYKYGFAITVIATICLIALIFFVVFYARELKTNPLIYGAQKYGVECTCTKQGYNPLFFNATTLYNIQQKRGSEGMQINFTSTSAE